MIINADSNSFEKVKEAKELFLLDVFASWCGPCQMIAGEFEKLDKMDETFFDIVKINSDENMELASKLGVSVLPTLMVYKNGKEVERFEGFKTADQILEFMEKHR